jgi:type III secretion control protein HpaP
MIESRPLRIITDDAEAQAEQRADDKSARRFDYAELVRRAAAQRALRARLNGGVRPAAKHAADAPGPQRLGLFAERVEASQASDDDTTGERDPLSFAHREALAERVCVAAQPAIDALFRTQGHFLELATEVAAFCADQAVGDAGHWEVRMPLDPRIFPGTTLFLSLSPLRLSLRFDTQSIETRQLLLHHSAMLEREVDTLLRAWGAPRDIELTVW